MMDLNGYVQAMKKKRELEMMLLRYNGELINERSNIKRNQAYLEYYREQKEDYENEMDGMLMLDSIKEKHLKLIGQVNQYQQLLNESRQMESKLIDSINQISLELKSYNEISKQYDTAFQERLALLKEKNDPEIETIERFIEFSKFYTKLQFNYKRAIRLINELNTLLIDEKKMKKDYSEYTKKIAELEEKLTAAEDRYYKKFSKMETMLASLNSNSDYITNLFSM